MEKNQGRVRVNLAFDMVGSQDESAVMGQKSPIIFLHGVTSAKESWNNVIRTISVATGRKAYAFDARNHGDSGWSDDFNYDIMQEDLLEFMNGLHAHQAILVGHSMGGKTAMYFAAKNNKRVEKLIVEDISIGHTEPHLREKAQKYVELLKHVVEQIPSEIKELEKAKQYVNEFLHEKTPTNFRSSRHGTADSSCLPLCIDEDGKFRWKTNLDAISKSFLGVPNSTKVESIYPGPTLILYGTRSPYKVSGDREYLRRIFPDSQFRAVEEAAHQIHQEFEDIFVKEVVEFINES